MRTSKLVFMGVALFCVTVSAAESVSRAPESVAPLADAEKIDAGWKSAPLDELRGEINRIGEAIREKVGLSEETKRKLEVVWTAPKYTSEKIEAKRKTIKAAEDAIIKAQIELREEIAKLPDVVKISAENETLQHEITSLRQQKKTLLQLLGDRSKAGSTSN